MKSKKSLLKESRLYVIIDKKLSGNKSIFNLANTIEDAGADIIQLRDKVSKKEAVFKDAFYLHKLLLDTDTIFIINDYLDIAKIVDSDGIHLGQKDTPIKIARCILGRDKIIGVSCHNLKQAEIAQKNGADYISIGPVFSTPLKPKYKPIGLELIEKLKKRIRIPFFLIGGVNEENINEVISFGINRVVVCRAICLANNVASAIKNLKKQLKL